MKTPVILSFAAGATCGALGFWLLQPAATQQQTVSASAASKPIGDSKTFTDGKFARQEKPVTPGKGEKDKGKEDLQTKIAAAVPGLLDRGRMEEMMRKNAETEVNREVDRLSLRLKLTGAQKDSLRKFLNDKKAKELALFRNAIKGDSSVAIKDELPSKQEFLKELLNDEQDAEYALAKQEERTGRAEDYAQRKIRKLDRDLNLSQQQEDAIFQAFAQRKLKEPEDQTGAGNFMHFSGGDGTTGQMSIAIAGDAAGLSAEPIEIELPEPMELPGAGGEDKDRPLLEPILTPEQLAVYDQRRKEQQEQMKGLIHVETNVETRTIVKP